MPLVPVTWFNKTKEVISHAPIFHRMCWLKTIAGAWTTSVRLHSYEGLSCCFGCSDTRDELSHYLRCPILLWFARDTLKEQENSVCCFERVSILNPSLSKLRMLAFCHALYHAVIKESTCVNPDGSFASPLIIQDKAQKLCDYCKYLVGSGA